MIQAPFCNGACSEPLNPAEKARHVPHVEIAKSLVEMVAAKAMSGECPRGMRVRFPRCASNHKRDETTRRQDESLRLVNRKVGESTI